MTVQAENVISAEKNGDVSFRINGDPRIMAVRLANYPDYTSRPSVPRTPEVIFETYSHSDNDELVRVLNHAGVRASGPGHIIKLADRNKLTEAMVALEWPGVVKEEIRAGAEKIWGGLDALKDTRIKHDGPGGRSL